METDGDRGIYKKFNVERTDGSSAPGGKHEHCRYFVIDLDHDPHAPAALRSYSNHCVGTHPALAHDLLDIAHGITMRSLEKRGVHCPVDYAACDGCAGVRAPCPDAMSDATRLRKVLAEVETWECHGETLKEAYDATYGAGAWAERTALPDKLRPTVICLCGSTRFKEQINEANRLETMRGKIVLAPGVFGHCGDPLTEADKEGLDELHLHKIDMADEVVVVCPGGYIGDSTRREIEYAKKQGKPIRYSRED